MPTIKDVAQLANVSPTTVSYVLNGTRYVSPATEARIRAAIEELDFRPDSVARSLRAKRTLTVGMLISDITNPFFADIVRGAQDVLTRKHYTLIVSNTDESPERELEAIHMLRQKKVDGLIAVSTGANADAFYKVAADKLPIVLVDRQLPNDHLCTVRVDDEQGAFQATKHLLQLGHHRIGLILGKAGISTTDHRRSGYERALRDAGITPDPSLIACGHSTVEGGTTAAHALLGLSPLPTAIFVTNSLMVLGLFMAMREHRLHCPEDIAVVGFDDTVWLSAFHPTLTTVSQPSYELGAQAAELVWSIMEEKKSYESCMIVLPAKLVIRESSGHAIPSVAP